MDDKRKLNDPVESINDELSELSVSTKTTFNYRPMPDPLSVYVPLDSLNEATIDSVVSTVLYSDKRDWNHSKRTLLAFLLAIHNHVSTIESNKDSNNPIDEKTIEQASKIRKLLVDKDGPDGVKDIDWNALQEQYKEMLNDKEEGLAVSFGVNYEPYYELMVEPVHPDIDQSREYMTRFRSHGWQPEELKLYWNAEQIENLCPKYESDNIANDVQSDEITPSYDPSDTDAVLALRDCPVSKRNHECTISYVHQGIEKAVFDAPEDAQLIVLNFANERSPGGGYLRHAWAQEEIILFNSDGYRSLLDLKYGRMGGGYAIPEYGVAYVRDIRFFHKETGKDRKADMLVSACYCLTDRPQLYDNPKTKDEWITNNIAKFRAFIAAAVANTKDDGSNTYLLLGPIGTGAFGNDTNDIGYAFREVLSSKMMGSKGPIRNAFKNIWFVSTDKWKNDLFEEILREDTMHLVED